MFSQPGERPRLHLFGPLRFVAADGTDVTPRGQKARGLLALLALARDGRLARVGAASRLWSGSHDAKANLRQCLRELKVSLDAAATGLLDSDDGDLVLDRSGLAIDTLALERLDETAFPLDRVDDDCLLRDIAVTDPLFEEWLGPERVRWRDRLHHCLEARARSCLEAGDPAAAIDWAARLVGFDPTLEAAHRILMQAHAAQGNRSLALRQFETCRDCLAAELGVGPSEATLALRAAIARPPGREREPPGDAPPPAAAAAPPSPPLVAPSGPAAQRAALPIILPGDLVRVALAPFRLLSDQPGDGLHALVLGEAVAAALCRFTDLAVIVEAGQPLAPTAAGPAAGYTVDGTVSRHDRTLRLTVRLCRADDHMLLWAEHFRIDRPDDAETLDGLARLVAARLERAVMLREMQNAHAALDETLSARACVFRAVPLIYAMTPDAADRAHAWLERARTQAPRLAKVRAWQAFLMLVRIGQQWVTDRDAAGEELIFYLQRALELDPDDAMTHALRGHVSAFVFHDFQAALDSFAVSRACNPGLAFGWGFSSVTQSYLGRTAEAWAHLHEYRRLQPIDPFPFYFDTAELLAHALAGNDAQAVRIGRRVLATNPNYFAAYRPMIAGLARTGQMAEARSLLARLRTHEPGFTLDWLRTRYPPVAPAQQARYLDSFRLVGVPNN
jgi:DNA-binding SARP family transcriptional activator/TolB-like protein